MMIRRGSDWLVIWTLTVLLCWGWLPAGAAVARAAESPLSEAAAPSPRPEARRFVGPEDQAPQAPAEKRAIPSPKAKATFLATPPVEPPKSASLPVKDAAAQRVTRIYYLKYALADSVVETLRNVAVAGAEEPLSITADKRLNCILVSAPPKTQEQVAELIENLDVPDNPVQTVQLRVFRLEYVDPSLAVSVLSSLLDSQNLRIAVDDRNSSIVLAGPPDVQEVAEELIRHLDVRAKEKTARPDSAPMHQVRVVWLANGLSDAEAAQPSKDLELVVAELSLLGVKELRQVGQIIVNAAVGESFEANGSPRLGKHPTQWNITGDLDRGQGTPRLSIQLQAAMPIGQQQKPYEVKLDTVISAEERHFVVLGVTPIEDKDWVFVVQIR